MILTDLAFQAIGTPYLWGGQNIIEGVDCSGFIRYLLRAVGCLPINDLSALGIYQSLVTEYAGSSTLPKEGSIIFFGESTRKINHVAYCVSPLLMIEAYGGPSITDLEKAKAFQNHEGAMVKLNPISRRSDVAGCIRPPYRNLGE